MTPTRGTDRVKLVACALLAFAAAGCGSAAAAPSALPALGAIPDVTSSSQYSFPLLAYFPDVKQARALADAESILESKCLKKFGMVLDPMPYPPDFQRPNQRLFGTVDLNAAKTEGYHHDTVGNSGVPAGAQVSEPANYVQVMNGLGAPAGSGIPDGGCIGEAQRELGGTGYNETLANELEGRAFTQSQADPRALVVNRQWSTCMAAKGYTFKDPWDALDNGGWSFTNPTPSAREIQTATADVECRTQTKLTGTWYALQVAYENQLIETNALKLSQNQKLQTVMLASAAKLTS